MTDTVAIQRFLQAAGASPRPTVGYGVPARNANY